MKKWFTILATVATMTVVFSSCSKSQPVSCGEGDITANPWSLQSYGLPDNLASLVPGTLVTISFLTDGTRIAGSDGCNAYFGNCQVDSKTCGLKIDQSSVSTTKKACDPLVAQQETKFLVLLKAAQRYTINAKILRITCGKEVLVFVPYVESQ